MGCDEESAKKLHRRTRAGCGRRGARRSEQPQLSAGNKGRGESRTGRRQHGPMSGFDAGPAPPEPRPTPPRPALGWGPGAEASAPEQAGGRGPATTGFQSESFSALLLLLEAGLERWVQQFYRKRDRDTTQNTPKKIKICSHLQLTPRRRKTDR